MRSKVGLRQVCAILLGGFICLTTHPAQAQSCNMVQATADLVQQTMRDGVEGPGGIKVHIDTRFDEHRDWLVNTFFENKVKPALQSFTKQMDAVAMQQALTIGTFFDAKQQLETQLLYQTLQVEAHKDYQPSKDFCTFGTNVRSLASSERNGQVNILALNSQQMRRHLGNAGMAAASSARNDKASRWAQFKEEYCDPHDNNWKKDKAANTGLQRVCGTGAQDKKRTNIDIDYTRLVDQPRTIDVAFQDTNLKPQEKDILAMSANLFGHQTLTRKIQGGDLTGKTEKGFQNQKLYMALRSVAAKRNVAQNSFNAIVGLKAKGSAENQGNATETRKFLAAVIKELGITEQKDIYDLIGEDPSYYAQLEILAKKIYQTPNFFAGLYDKPANVERKSVALKAIELMLDRAIYESQLRQEMAMSVLLSSKLEPEFNSAATALTGAKQ